MNTARKGNEKDLRTADHLRADGWLVASRRHVGGAGDLLAVKPNERSRLIEVKCTQTPWAHFGPDDRAALIAEAERFGLVAELAYWAPRARSPEFFDQASFPS